jgi:peroxiredoxin
MRRFFLVILALTIAFSLFSCSKGKDNTVFGNSAPDFTLSDLNGNKVNLSAMKGKVVMVEFWATWCPPCKESIPEINKLYIKYKDKGFTVLAISVDKGLDSAELAEFAREYSLTYPVMLDNGKASSSYRVGSIPTSFMIDKNGRMVSKHIGYDPDLLESLSKEIETLL